MGGEREVGTRGVRVWGQEEVGGCVDKRCEGVDKRRCEGVDKRRCEGVDKRRCEGV